MREKQDYREQLALMIRKIEEAFPNTMGMLDTEQVAQILGCNIKTVHNNINRKYNPLPAKNIAVGRRKVYKVPLVGLARWCLGG